MASAYKRDDIYSNFLFIKSQKLNKIHGFLFKGTSTVYLLCTNIYLIDSYDSLNLR